MPVRLHLVCIFHSALCTYMVLQIGLLIYLACPWTLSFVVNSSNLALHLRYLLCIVISAKLCSKFWAMSGILVDMHSLLHIFMASKSCSRSWISAQDLINLHRILSAKYVVVTMHLWTFRIEQKTIVVDFTPFRKLKSESPKCNLNCRFLWIFWSTSEWLSMTNEKLDEILCLQYSKILIYLLNIQNHNYSKCGWCETVVIASRTISDICWDPTVECSLLQVNKNYSSR